MNTAIEELETLEDFQEYNVYIKTRLMDGYNNGKIPAWVVDLVFRRMPSLRGA